MCGIHFVINSSGYMNKLDDFLTDCFHANQVRGTDSSGIFQIDNKYNKEQTRDIRLFKKNENGSEFLGYQSAREIIQAATRMPVTVGHVRAATYGTVSDENAHPFIAKRADGSRIIGVHNGSLVDWHKNEGAEHHEVDSQWLFNTLAKDGISSFEGINGAFALVWYDTLHPDTLFVARNDKRPLFWCLTEDKKALMACSELGMLGWLADRNGFKLAANTEGRRFFYPEQGYIHAINLRDPTHITKEKFADYDASKKIYAKPTPPSVPVNLVPHKPQFNSQWDETIDAQRQKARLNSIKEALATARNRRAAVGNDDEEVQGDLLAKEVTDWLKNKHGLVGELGYQEPLQSPLDDTAVEKENFQFVVAPNTQAATRQEKKRAKGIGIFGLCVKFCGYFYDEDTGQVFGDFRTIENNRVVVYDSVVRCLSSGAADAKYVKPTGVVDMVVIGVTDNDKTNDGKPYLVLVDRDFRLETHKIDPSKQMVPTAHTLH